MDFALINPRLRIAALAFLGFIAIAAVSPLLRPQPSHAASGFYLSGSDAQDLLKVHAVDSLLQQDGHYFVSAGVCDNCHASDPNGVALVDANGHDINMVDDWRTTMMALSAKDPFWRAQVSHEVLTNPGHQAPLVDKCTSCHAPLGRYTHLFEQQGQAYSMAALAADTLGLDGVSCMACHSQKADSLGMIFSGNLFLDTTRTVYGPFPGPNVAPMFTSFHLIAAYGPHVQSSGLCAGCHTLVTETADLQGQYTGGHFVEQATYHEWVNSDYINLDISCQTCHMPSINTPVYLSGPNVNSTNPRFPIYKHHFVGANSFMLKMMKTYRDSMDIRATPAQFDTTIARTNRLLQQEALDMTLTQMARSSDSVFYDLKLTNRAGHKFPSGYPSRRIFVEFVLRDANGDTLFQSGVLGSNYEVKGQDPGYEPHHNLINDPGQAQIYEFIMADVNGNVTTTLERAATHLKDNRLVPQGFLSTHPNYPDTTEIAGSAETDPDFNRNGSTEGTGSDIVHYHIPLAGYSGNLQVSARVWYQTVRPGWLDETFSHNSPDIDQFRRWYNASDKSVVLVGELLTQDVLIGTSTPSEPSLLVYPNPTTDGWVKMMLPRDVQGATISVYTLEGKRVTGPMHVDEATTRLRMPEVSGTYLLDVQGDGWRKVIRVGRR